MQRFWGDVLAAVGFIGLGAWIIIYSRSFPVGGNNFPDFAAVCMILMSIVVIVKAVLSKAPEMKARIIFNYSWLNIKHYVIALLVVAYWPLSFVLGYFTTTLLFLVISAVLTGIRDLKIIAITAIILIPALYVFFVLALQANLPEGILI